METTDLVLSIVGAALGIAVVLIAAMMWIAKVLAKNFRMEIQAESTKQVAAVEKSIESKVNGKIDRLQKTVDDRGLQMTEWQRQIEARLGEGAQKMEDQAERLTRVEREQIGTAGEIRGMKSMMNVPTGKGGR